METHKNTVGNIIQLFRAKKFCLHERQSALPESGIMENIDRVGVNDVTNVILPDKLQKLTTLLDNSLETLAVGNPQIQTEALSTTKHIFELCMPSFFFLAALPYLTVSQLYAQRESQDHM